MFAPSPEWLLVRLLSPVTIFIDIIQKPAATDIHLITVSGMLQTKEWITHRSHMRSSMIPGVKGHSPDKLEVYSNSAVFRPFLWK